MDDRDKKEKLARFLNDSYLDFARDRGVYTSLAEFSKWLDVPNTSLSQWMNQIRLPAGKNIYKLGDKLGPELYEILELPLMVPEDQDLRFIVKAWGALSMEDQFKITRTVRDIVERTIKNKITDANLHVSDN